MGRPTAKENICNLSQDYLKQAPINSISTPVTSSEYVYARWYDIERQGALRAHPWKFAIKRAVLNPDPLTIPAFGYLYAYDLPNDYLRKISIGNDNGGDLKQQIEIENGQILSNGGSDNAFNPSPQSLYLRYVYDFTTVVSMDPLFVKVFALGMAIDLSPKFSVSATAVDRLMKTFEEINTEARAANGQDNPPKRIQESQRLARRRGYQYDIYASPFTVFGT
jgi:hypothetical protein